MKQSFLRKILAISMTTLVFSLFLTVKYVFGDDEVWTYNQGNEFIGWFFTYFVYIGAITLVYGTSVSILIEQGQRKWFPSNQWLYVVLHGIFGLANGLFFEDIHLAWYGMIAGLMYGMIDRICYYYPTFFSKSRWFLLGVVILLVGTWGTLQAISPAMPPFTKKDAIEFVTLTDDSIEENFPHKEGTWKGNIDGYDVVRVTKAKKLKEEVYEVTLHETWSVGEEKGNWSASYRVDRSTTTATRETGNMPPYYE